MIGKPQAIPSPSLQRFNLRPYLVPRCIKRVDLNTELHSLSSIPIFPISNCRDGASELG